MGSLGKVAFCSPISSLPTDLSKHRRYEIRMSVYNAVGEGPPSPPQEVFVGEAGEFARGGWNILVHSVLCPYVPPASPLYSLNVPLHIEGGFPPHLGCSRAVTLLPPSAQCPLEHHRTWP